MNPSPNKRALLLLTVAVTSLTTSAVVARLAEPAVQGAPGQAAYPEASQRGNARVFYWGPKDNKPNGGSIGQFAIDYGTPPWKDSYDGALDSQRDVRWRFGQNFWTNLDTNIDLTIAGVSIPAGYYYLGLEYTSKDEWILWALDPDEVRKEKLDAFEIAQTKGGIKIPLSYSEADDSASKLKITLMKSALARNSVEMRIQFGGHMLKAPIKMLPEA